MDHVLTLMGAAQPAILGSTPTEIVKSRLYVRSLKTACTPGAGKTLIVLRLVPGSLQVSGESVLPAHTKLATEQFRDFLNPNV